MTDGLQLEATRRGAVPSCPQDVGLELKAHVGCVGHQRLARAAEFGGSILREEECGNVRGREREWGGKDLELFGEGQK